ncbi:hypothetical protein AKJ09_01530 [Labilithrix luteola]|uniref:Uncharacterized protein n=1 Tax=Labilithrix luteola TaxID=1391654 RepID=A0A0K1PN97_9BACT|nr:hypothetical protein AKJ09_01530 [Labilithrix luteola]
MESAFLRSRRHFDLADPLFSGGRSLVHGEMTGACTFRPSSMNGAHSSGEIRWKGQLVGRGTN